jgi:uncharacterized protein (DUF1778 family)
MRSSARDTTINLRVSTARRSLIDQAAEVLGKTRTEFLLEAAAEKAQRVLLDQTVFALDPGAFRRFEELLDAPVNRSAVNRLLKRRAPWERKSK